MMVCQCRVDDSAECLRGTCANTDDFDSLTRPRQVLDHYYDTILSWRTRGNV